MLDKLMSGGGGYSASSSSGATGGFSDRSAINVAPVAFNMGAIMQPYMEGSPENGGYGLELMSRYAPGYKPASWSVTGDNLIPIGIVLVVVLGGVFLIKSKR